MSRVIVSLAKEMALERSQHESSHFNTMGLMLEFVCSLLCVVPSIKAHLIASLWESDVMGFLSQLTKHGSK